MGASHHTDLLTSDRARELSSLVDSISVIAVYHTSPKPRAVKPPFDYAHDFLIIILNVFMARLGLCGCARAFSR